MLFFPSLQLVGKPYRLKDVRLLGKKEKKKGSSRNTHTHTLSLYVCVCACVRVCVCECDLFRRMCVGQRSRHWSRPGLLSLMFKVRKTCHTGSRNQHSPCPPIISAVTEQSCYVGHTGLDLLSTLFFKLHCSESEQKTSVQNLPTTLSTVLNMMMMASLVCLFTRFKFNMLFAQF